MIRKAISILGLFIVTNTFSFAQPGTLDTDFGINGRVVTELGLDKDYAYDVAIQDDGKIVVGGEQYISGNRYFTLAR